MASRTRSRESVPLLHHAPYSVYMTACQYLVHDWLQGTIGAEPPTDSTTQEAIRVACGLAMTEKHEHEDNGERGNETNRRYSHSLPYQTLSFKITETDMDDDVKQVYECLLTMNATNHLKVATSHRMWISMTHTFFEMIGVEFPGDMNEMIKIHDLSKYTHSEILGYTVMFGDMQNNWRELKKQEEKDEWALALEHHYKHNPHHPEYYYTKLEDGRFANTGTVAVIDDDVNGKLHLDEGIIDMLASKAERTMREDVEISVTKWMEIAEMYMRRYAPRDREYVVARLREWRGMAQAFVANVENEDRLKGFLLGKTVIA